MMILHSLVNKKILIVCFLMSLFHSMNIFATNVKFSDKEYGEISLEYKDMSWTLKNQRSNLPQKCTEIKSLLLKLKIYLERKDQKNFYNEYLERCFNLKKQLFTEILRKTTAFVDLFQGPVSLSKLKSYYACSFEKAVKINSYIYSLTSSLLIWNFKELVKINEWS